MTARRWPAHTTRAAQAIRDKDWGATPLGACTLWPPELRCAVSAALDCPLAQIVLWGPDLLQIYNDAYREILKTRAPAALGQATRDCWPEVWDFNQPIYRRAMQAGEATLLEDQSYVLNVDGAAQTHYFSVAYAPMRVEDGSVGGVLVTVTPATERVARERRDASLLSHSQRAASQLAQFFEQAPGFFAVARGPEHVFEFANEAYKRLTGRRQLVGSRVVDALPEVAGQGFIDLLDQVYATGQPFVGRGMSIVLQRDPERPPEKAYIDFIYQAVVEPDGQVSGIAAHGFDVTEAHRAALALTKLNETLEHQVSERTADRNRLWQLSTDLMLVAGLDGVMMSINPAWSATLGWSDAELIGRPLFEFVHRDDLERTHRAAQAVLQGKPLWYFENRYRHKAGHHVWISWSATVGNGLMVAVGRDVTAAKERIDALERSEARVRSIFQTSYTYQGFLTPQGLLLDVNRTSLASIGAQLEEVVGRPIWDTPWFTETPGLPELVQAAVPLAAAGQTVRQEVSLNLLIGRRDFDFSMRPVFDSAGAVIAIVPEAMDITERRAAEAQLRQSQKMEAIGQLTGGVAHDFNNLLQVIAGNLHLIGRYANGHSQIDERVAKALAGVQRGAKLAGQLLAFSRRQALDPKVVDLGRLVTGLDDMLHRTLGEAVQIETRAAHPPWNTFVDPAQIENAVLNLALNARDAMGAGGRLSIAVSNASVASANAAEHAEVPPGDYVLLAVSDTGCGMSAEVQAQAFEPFFSTKAVGSGTGLGLSMVYGFVKQSGGHVAIRSEVGRGTTITLYLPRTLGTEAATVPAAAGPVEGGGETILVAEDDEGVRGTVVEMLRELGYRVLVAPDAASALGMVESGARIDLLFTDVVMPGPLRSPELAARVRLALPKVAVLFTSGYSESAIVHDGRLDAGVELLAKPYARDALARRVRQVLNSRAQTAAS